MQQIRDQVDVVLSSHVFTAFLFRGGNVCSKFRKYYTVKIFARYTRKIYHTQHDEKCQKREVKKKLCGSYHHYRQMRYLYI